MSPAIGIGIGTCFGGGQAPAWTPKKLSSIVAWWRSDLGITTVSGNVSSWVDQIGGLDLAQSNAARRPTYNTGATIPVLEFRTGVGALLVAAAPAFTTKAYTVITVHSVPIANPTGNYSVPVPEWRLRLNWDDDPEPAWNAGSSESMAPGKGAGGSVAESAALCWCLVSHDGTGTTVRLVRSGTAYTTGSLAACATPTTATALGATSSAGYPVNADVREVIACNAKLTPAEEALWAAYSLKRYGV